MLEITTASEALEFIENHDTFLFDCDGVIWLGYKTPIPGSVEALAYLHSLGKRVIFVSNNSLHSRRDFVDILHSFGLTHVSKEDIFTPTFVVAQYVNGMSLIHKRIFVLGGPGIIEELELANVPIFHVNEDGTSLGTKPEKVDAVVVGFDSKLTYEKLAVANTYLRQTVEATGRVYHHQHGQHPTHGEWLTAWHRKHRFVLIYSSERIPTIIGKPSTKLLDCILDKLHIDPKRTCMIGDRLDTDIVFGKKGGMNTLLVFSGYSTRKELDEAPVEKQPTFVCQSIGDLVNFINQQ